MWIETQNGFLINTANVAAIGPQGLGIFAEMPGQLDNDGRSICLEVCFCADEAEVEHAMLAIADAIAGSANFLDIGQVVTAIRTDPRRAQEAK